MAPIQTFESISTQTSALNRMPTLCRCGRVSSSSSTSSESMEWGLPIALRGSFFHDSFFRNVRSYFDSAVQEMLSNWGQADMLSDARQVAVPSLVNNFSLYRQLRSRGQQEVEEKNQATTVVSDNRTHKVVMDVHDFMEGDVKVKVVGDKEVLVEGQAKTNSGSGSVSSRAFSRRFSFPSSVNMAEVTSVMSSDGVLTIEAPKLERKDGGLAHGSVGTSSTHNIKVECSSSSASDEACASGISPTATAHNDAKDTVYYCKGCNKKIGSWYGAPETKTTQQDGMKVPIKIATSMTRAHQNVPVTQETQSAVRSEVQSKDIKVERHEQENSDALRSKTIRLDSGSQSQSSTGKSSFEVPVTVEHQQQQQFGRLPIVRRGPFFSDSFFQDIHNDFQLAVREVLSKWGKESSFMDDAFSAYRNLRLCDLKEETQAVRTVEDESSHKFVLDVQDFTNGGEVTVKAISDREIVIEGHVEKGEGGAKSVKRFLKRFNLPGDIRLDSVTSVMSSDGVLTITAPKKPSSVQLREVLIPMSIEGEEESKNSSSHLSSSATDAKKSSNVHSDILMNSASNVIQTHVPSQVNTAKEHIIPISVEGNSDNAGSTHVTHHVNVQRVQKDAEGVQQNSQGNSGRQMNSEMRNVEVVSQANSSSSSASQGVMAGQANTTKGHIIPITVEGSSINSRAQVASHQVQEQKECKENVSGITQQQIQKSQEDIKPQASFAKENMEQKVCQESVSGITQQQMQKSQEERKPQASSAKGNMEMKFMQNLENTANQAYSSPENTLLKTMESRTHQVSSATENMQSKSTESMENSAQQASSTKETVQLKCMEDKTNQACSAKSMANVENKMQQASSATENMQLKSTESKSDSSFKHNNVYQLAHQQKQSTSTDDRSVASSFCSRDEVGACASPKKYLPISRRGLFFDDRFFQDYQEDFQSAVRDVLVKSRQYVDKADDMTAYRSLRQRDLRVENQALHVQEDQESLKIVVDAKDFVNGDITVCVDGEELVIEGRAENSEARSSNSLTFSHRFLLPEMSDITTITSAISSDGILTVNSPKGGDPSADAVKRMSSEARSKHESHNDGGHKWEEKRVKESSEEANGYSSRTYSSSYSSRQQQTSTF